MNLHLPSLEEIRSVVREELTQALQALQDSGAPLLTVREAANQLGVSERTIKRRIATGELPVVRVGRSVRIDRTALRPSTLTVASLAREILVQ